MIHRLENMNIHKWFLTELKEDIKWSSANFRVGFYIFNILKEVLEKKMVGMAIKAVKNLIE